MKLLIVNVDCGTGSTGRICTDAASSLIQRGVDVRIAYGRDTKAGFESISYRIGGNYQVLSHAFFSRLLDCQGLCSKKATRTFLEWAEEYDPDCIWLHNIHGYYLNYEMVFSWIKKRPWMKVVWTLHDCWAFTGHCSHFTLNKCDLWKSGCEKCRFKKEYPKSVFLSMSKRNYLRKRKAFLNIHNMEIITPSEWFADLVKQSFLKVYPIRVINNGIDTSVFKPMKSRSLEKYSIDLKKKIVLGVAGVWSKNKGFDDFIKLSEYLNHDYQIVLVGVNKKQQKKLPKKIIAIEKTDNTNELAELYSSAYVYVNLSYEENYPTTNIESVACGTPVVTYETGGSVESVVPNCVVKQGKVKEIAELIMSGNFGIKTDFNFDKDSMLTKVGNAILNDNLM